MRIQTKDDLAHRYMVLCNLIEAIWAKRLDRDYYNIDLTDLPPFTSPQARRIATFIEELFEEEV